MALGIRRPRRRHANRFSREADHSEVACILRRGDSNRLGTPLGRMSREEYLRRRRKRRRAELRFPAQSIWPNHQEDQPTTSCGGDMESRPAVRRSVPVPLLRRQAVVVTICVAAGAQYFARLERLSSPTCRPARLAWSQTNPYSARKCLMSALLPKADISRTSIDVR